jgi:hypothetical protein
MSPLLRVVTLLAVLGAFLGIVLSYDEPLVMLVGLAVPAWIALEACWRFFEQNS